jgi:hypothetical protein
VFTFYASLLLFFARGREAGDRDLNGLIDGWRGCYDKLEGAFREALDAIYQNGLLGDVSSMSKSDAIRKYAYPGVPEASWTKLRNDEPDQFYTVVRKLIEDRLLSPERAIAERIPADAEFLKRQLKPFRNLFFHAGGRVKELVKNLDFTGAEWNERANAVEDVVSGMMGALHRTLQVTDMVQKGQIGRGP